MTTRRVVFDTNILISALLSATGAPFRCPALARSNTVLSVSCQQILREFDEKLQQKFHFVRDRAWQAVEEVRQFSELVEVPGQLQGVVTDDPDDEVILECAIRGNAAFVVTGDKHLVKLQAYRDISIIRAQALLELVAHGS